MPTSQKCTLVHAQKSKRHLGTCPNVQTAPWYSPKSQNGTLVHTWISVTFSSFCHFRGPLSLLPLAPHFFWRSSSGCWWLAASLRWHARCGCNAYDFDVRSRAIGLGCRKAHGTIAAVLRSFCLLCPAAGPTAAFESLSDNHGPD